MSKKIVTYNNLKEFKAKYDQQVQNNLKEFKAKYDQQVQSYGYQTAANVQSKIESYGYQTASQVNSAIQSAAGSYMGITRGTLSAGSTSIALTDSRIRSNSAINIYTSRYGVNPSAISVSGTTVTLTFKAQSSNIEVGISVIN